MNTIREYDIAIIGCAGQFPGAPDTDTLWKHLLAGQSGIRELTEQERHSNKSNSHRIWQGGVLENADSFDSDFFGIKTRDAELMDPQLRLALQNVWQTLAQSGYAPECYDGRIGLYLGAGLNFEWLTMAHNFVADNLAAKYELNSLTYRDFFATRIAYLLNLKGPALTTNTACSTSLVNIHLACQAILADDCDIAVAGGIHLLPERIGYEYQEGMILSPDGFCRPFDAEAAGTVWGEGGAFVTLKRANEAIADKDQIIAIIRGTAINNDGNKKVGYTAPSVLGQQKVIEHALDFASLTAEDIDFVETHGTGTKLGDPLEAKALLNVYSQRKKPLYLGAIKANIGHLDVAAGATGLIKAALSLNHRILPPHPAFNKLSISIQNNHDILRINREPLSLSQNKPCYAGVSSFGIGGTNAHVILATPPKKAEEPAGYRYQVLLRSAKSMQSCLDMLTELNSSITYTSCAANAYTLWKHRPSFNYRGAVVIDQKTGSAINNISGEAQTKPKITFVFPGQGSQYRTMAKELYETLAPFKKNLDHCFSILEKSNFQHPADRLFLHENIPMLCTAETQPLLFSVEYALAKTLNEFGIIPDAMIGHSLGEFVAATLADVFTLDEALNLVIARGEIMSEAPKGIMLAVTDLPTGFIFPEGVSTALYNSPHHTVLACSAIYKDNIINALSKNNIKYKILATKHAFHTNTMHQSAQLFTDIMKNMGIQPRAAKCRLVSNVTGEYIKDEITDISYWAKHLLSPVQFSQGIDTLLTETSPKIFIEVGPAGGLTNFIRHHSQFSIQHQCIRLMGNKHDPLTNSACFFTALAECWIHGYDVNWQFNFENNQYTQVATPPYRFSVKNFTKVRQQTLKNNETIKENITNTSSMTSLSTSTLICRAWEKTFGYSISDLAATNFFASGGDSLLAVSFSAELAEQFGLKIPLQIIMQTKNLSALADKINKLKLTTSPITIITKKNNTPIPVTPAQERLWLLDQFSGIVDYHICEAFRIHGHLSQSALHDAFSKLIVRHPALRTTYKETKEKLIQIVNSVTEININMKFVQPEKLPEIIKIDSRMPFDLAKDLMIRVYVYKLKEDENVILMVINHISADGASINILARELNQLYTANLKNKDIILPPLNSCYADYAYQLEQQSEKRKKTLRYWSNKLTSSPTVLNFPLAQQRKKPGSQTSATAKMVINKKQTDLLNKICCKHQVTSFVFISAVLSVYLGRVMNTQDIAIGTTIADRQDNAWQNIIGYFTNTMVMRYQLDMQQTFSNLLQKSQEELLVDWQHLDLSFTDLLEQLGTPRNETFHPLFQTMLVSIERNPLKLDTLLTEYEPLEPLSMPFDLYLTTWKENDEIHIEWKYRQDLFTKENIDIMIEQYSCLFQGACNSPEQPIHLLPLENTITKEHRNKWQTNSDLYLPLHSNTILDLFNYQVLQHPENLVIHDINGILNYKQLDILSNKLAHLLIDNGIKSGMPVAFSLPRGRWVSIAIIAILKTGAHYVPLDPAYPDSRLMYILNDSKVCLGLDMSETQKSWPCSFVTITPDLLDQQPDTPLEIIRSAKSLAYIIYTSGSTGQPKGVTVTDNNLYHYTHAAQTYYQIKPNDKIAQISSIGFDISVEEHIMAFSFGACLVYRDEIMLTSLQEFILFIKQHNISVISLPTGLWNILCDELDSQLGYELQNILRLCILGGEALQPTRLAHWHCNVGTKIQLLNSYGPTETTIIATIMDVTSPSKHISQVLIGRPIPGVSTWVMDNYGNPVPVGTTGELWITGPTVTPGYIDRPKQTKNAFIKKTLSNGEILHFYRTGDKVSWNNQGNLCYHGRIDNQIKYQGFRIEPGEIENTLIQLPMIQDAIVDIYQETLSAWIIIADKEDTEKILKNCHDILTKQLPEYMRPKRWAFMPNFPLTQNGKVNRQALAEPHFTSHTESDRVFTTTENELTILWEDILQYKILHPYDNFFEKGGHSLKLTGLFSKIERSFGIKPDYAEFFSKPTLHSLAKMIDEQLENQDARIRKGHGIKAPTDKNILSKNPSSLDSETNQKNELMGITPINFINGNDSSPLILLPGIGGMGHSLYHLANKLNSQRIIGFNIFDSDSLDIETLARKIVNEILDIEHIQQPIFIGHSLGGCIAVLCSKYWKEITNNKAIVILLDSFPLNSKDYSEKEKVDYFMSLTKEKVNLTQSNKMTALSTYKDLFGFLQKQKTLTSEETIQILKIFEVYKRQLSYEFNPEPSSVDQLYLINTLAGPCSKDFWQNCASKQFEHHIVMGDHHSILTQDLSSNTASYINKIILKINSNNTICHDISTGVEK